MTNEEIAIRKALEAGPTPGPWNAYITGGQTPAQPPAGGRVVELPLVYQDKAIAWRPADATFIAACNPEAMSALLAEIDRLRAEPGVMFRNIDGVNNDVLYPERMGLWRRLMESALLFLDERQPEAAAHTIRLALGRERESAESNHAAQTNP